MSWNVKGLNNPVKRRKVLSFVKSRRYSIVYVQETHLSSPESQRLFVDWVGFVGVSSSSSKSRGVATLISQHIQFKCIKQSSDEAGRMLLMLCVIQGRTLILANVYAANVDDPTF